MNLKLQRPYISTVILSVLVFVMLIPGVVYAQSQGDVKLTANVGFAGNCKENNWIPLRVTVENKGADLNGRIQVAYENNKGGQSGYAVDMALPSSSRKEFFLYLHPDGYFQKLNVNLTVGDRVVASIPLNPACIAQGSLIIGLLTDTPTAFAGLGTLEAGNGFTRIAPLKLTDLPDRPQGWQALDALVISGVDTAAITDQQRSALRTWLAQGGKLLLTGGPNWQNVTSGLDEFLPIDVNNTQTVSTLSALQHYMQVSASLDTPGAILAVGQLRPKTTVLVAQNDQPVLTQKQLGYGNIYYLAADPSIEPLSGWAGMNNLYEHLLAAPILRPIWMNTPWDTYNANQALAALPALGLPPTIFVLCLLGVYILIVGPVNYLILRIIKRQEWAWITIPAFVIGFTAIGYFSGYWIRGSRPILNRLAVIQAWDDLDQAQATGLVGVYSPGRTRYTLQAGNDILPYPFDSNNQSLQANQGWLSLQQGSEMFLPDVLVESGGMKSISLEGSLPAITFKHDLTLTLDAKRPMLSGKITNTSSHPIKNARLTMAGNMLNMGDFLPGASKQVQILLNLTPQGTDLYDFQGQSMYSSYSNEDFDDKVIRQHAIMRSMLGGQSNNQNQITSGIYLTGWLDEGLLPTAVQWQGFDSVDTTFYMLNLSPTVVAKAGDLKLTPALFTWSASSQPMLPYQSQYPPDIPENGYVLTFKLARPLQYNTVKSLTLSLNQATTYGNTIAAPGNEVNAFVWNWQSGVWTQLDNLVWGDNKIADPARFVMAGGEIKLRMIKNNTSSRNPNPIGSSYFTLVVQP